MAGELKIFLKSVLLQHSWVRDRIVSINRFRPMADHPHRSRAGTAGRSRSRIAMHRNRRTSNAGSIQNLKSKALLVAKCGRYEVSLSAPARDEGFWAEFSRGTSEIRNRDKMLTSSWFGSNSPVSGATRGANCTQNAQNSSKPAKNLCARRLGGGWLRTSLSNSLIIRENTGNFAHSSGFCCFT